MTRLLTIKSGSDYFRFSAHGHSLCAMNKASVYGLDAEKEVKELLKSVRADGFVEAKIYQLTITETLYEE